MTDTQKLDFVEKLAVAAKSGDAMVKLEKLAKAYKQRAKLPEATRQQVEKAVDDLVQKAQASKKTPAKAVEKLEEKAAEKAATEIIAPNGKPAVLPRKMTVAERKEVVQSAIQPGSNFSQTLSKYRAATNKPKSEAIKDVKDLYQQVAKVKSKYLSETLSEWSKQIKLGGTRPTADLKAKVVSNTDVQRDAPRQAKPFGKRPSKPGAKRPFYWENRANRADVKQGGSRPLLAEGGTIAENEFVDDMGNVYFVEKEGIGYSVLVRIKKSGIVTEAHDDIFGDKQEAIAMAKAIASGNDAMMFARGGSLDHNFLNIMKTVQDKVPWTDEEHRKFWGHIPKQKIVQKKRVGEFLIELVQFTYSNKKAGNNYLIYVIQVTPEGGKKEFVKVGASKNAIPRIWNKLSVAKTHFKTVVESYQFGRNAQSASASRSEKADGKAKALSPGKRKGRKNEFYYEYRRNRSDITQGNIVNTRFAKGGVAPFSKKVSAVANRLEGTSVPSKYQTLYGTTYNQGEAKAAATSIIGKQHWEWKRRNKKAVGGFVPEFEDGGVIDVFEQGGEIKVRIINRGKKYDKKKYSAIFDDYDRDGVPNIDDAAPLSGEITERVDEPSLSTAMGKLVELKKAMDDEMYNFISELKQFSPKGSRIEARTKTPFSIVNKLITKRLTDKKRGLTDLIGTTIVVKSQAEADEVRDAILSGSLGQVMDFEDFYTNPQHGYRAYHFVLNYHNAPIEVQVKTQRQKELNYLTHEPYKLNKLNIPVTEQMTLNAAKADMGDAEAIRKHRAFLKQPNVERAFFAE